MTSTNFNVSEAHRITGKSRTTIKKHMEEGRLPYTLDKNGKRVINAQDLITVYGDDCNFDRANGKNPSTVKIDTVKDEKNRSQNLDVQFLKDLLDKEKADRAQERELLAQQIENLKDDLKAERKKNDGPKLLEDKSNETKEFQKWMRGMEQRIEHQEKESKELNEKRQNRLRQYKAMKNKNEELETKLSELLEGKNKPFWQKLFG